jgi:hypothetical protein
MDDRRGGGFNEKLAFVLVIGGIIGALVVLLDPVITITTSAGTVLHFGGTGFSDQLKGAVVSMILVSGFAAVITYYFGSSNSDKVKNQTISALAASSLPAALEPAAPPLAAEKIEVAAQPTNEGTIP